MLQNQPNPTQIFRTSLRSWRANYVARQQALAELAGTSQTTESDNQASSTRVKRLAPRRRKRRHSASA
jgi:hypothetical protein